MSILINLLLAFNVVVCVLIVLLVLMQRPKSEGLGAAFGGGMTENLFGAQTSNVLANGTKWLAGIFFLLTLIISILTSHFSAPKSTIGQKLATAPKPVATPQPAVTGSSAPAAAASQAAPAPAASTPAPATPAPATPAPTAAAATPAPSAPAAPAAPAEGK